MVNNQNKYKIKENIVNGWRNNDHNILSISICNKSKLDGDMGRENPYSNKTYEYVIDHESTEWKDLYDFFDEGHIDENSDAEKQLDDLYNLVDIGD